MPAQRVRTTIELLCHETPDFIIAPNLSLLNMVSDFSLVDYMYLGNATGVGLSTSHERS